jgi:hypothetical protein
MGSIQKCSKPEVLFSILGTDKATFTRSEVNKLQTPMNGYWRILKLLNTLHFNKDVVSFGPGIIRDDLRGPCDSKSSQWNLV